MTLVELVVGEPLKRILAIKELKGLDMREYLGLLSTELSEKVRQAICCYGYTRIDEPSERGRIADKITDAVGAAIPPPYKLSWPVIRPFARRIVRALLDEAADKGEAFCEGVECAISPIVVE